jgi:glutathione S-transferase
LPRDDIFTIVFKKDTAMFHFTALVTCLSILTYFFTSIQVSRARVAFGIKAPAVSGNPDFERVFRVQMNTLEWMPIFLPSLWLFAIYINDALAAALGLVWIAGRILYMTGYSQGRRQTRAGLRDSGRRRHAALARRAGRCYLAADSCLKLGRLIQISVSTCCSR